MSWHSLEIPADLAAPGKRAPLALPPQTSRSFRPVLLKLLDGSGVPPAALEAGLSTAAALLEGAQGFVQLANELVEPGATPRQVLKLSEDLLREVGALLRQRRGAYAVHQMAGVLSAALPAGRVEVELPRLPRLRDFMTPLETAIERWNAAAAIDAGSLGKLCVHLDEFYDDCALQLARFYHVIDRDQTAAQALAPDHWRRLYTEFVQASFNDHLLAEAAPGGSPPAEVPAPGAATGDGDRGPGSALLALLPLLSRALLSLPAR